MDSQDELMNGKYLFFCHLKFVLYSRTVFDMSGRYTQTWI